MYNLITFMMTLKVFVQKKKTTMTSSFEESIVRQKFHHK